jgi:hypothetical protein
MKPPLTWWVTNRAGLAARLPLFTEVFGVAHGPCVQQRDFTMLSSNDHHLFAV